MKKYIPIATYPKGMKTIIRQWEQSNQHSIQRHRKAIKNGLPVYLVTDPSSIDKDFTSFMTYKENNQLYVIGFLRRGR